MFARRGLTLENEQLPVFSPCGMIVLQGMFVNVCHIVIPKGKT